MRVSSSTSQLVKVMGASAVPAAKILAPRSITSVGGLRSSVPVLSAHTVAPGSRVMLAPSLMNTWQDIVASSSAAITTSSA